MDIVIGLDFGTTTLKAVAFTPDGQEIAHAAAEVPTLLESGHAEQVPDLVADLAVAMLAQVAESVRDQGHTVARVGISAAMHSILAVDAQDAALTNALLWMDARAQPQANALWAAPNGPALYARTGTPIHAMSPLAKLLWVREEQPTVWQRAAKFVSLKEWIWHRWFGAWQIDTSLASATGLYNLQTGLWDAEVLTMLALTPQHFSTLVATTYTRQGIREPRLIAAGLADTAFTIGASDGVLANLGVQAITPDALVLTIGTSCAVRRGTLHPFTNAATRSFCYVLARDRFIIGAASNSGGVVLDWLAQHLLSPTDAISPEQWAALLQSASEVTSDGLLCLPYMAGERAPLWDAEASGTLYGLRLHHRPAHLVRATIEGILFNAYWLASSITDPTQPPQRLIATGKVLSTPWVRQLAADIFQLPVADGGQSDASAKGAAQIADIAAGLATWPTVLPRAELVTLLSGNNDYQAHYARWRDVVATLLMHPETN